MNDVNSASASDGNSANRIANDGNSAIASGGFRSYQ